jgi:hypothetical protein
MSWAIAGTMIATTVVSTASQYLGAKKAEKSAKKQAKLQAEAEQKLTDERVLTLQKQERIQYGQTIAGYAGGGVLARAPGLDPKAGMTAMSGSPEAVVQEAAREFKHERDITREVGALNISQIKQAGRATANAYRFQGYASVASGIGSILSIYGGGKSGNLFG